MSRFHDEPTLRPGAPLYSQADSQIPRWSNSRAHTSTDERSAASNMQRGCKSQRRPQPGVPRCAREPRSREIGSQQTPTAHPETPHLTYRTRPVQSRSEPQRPKNGLRYRPESTHLCASRRAIRLSSTMHPLTPAKSHLSIRAPQIYLSLPALRDNSSRNLFHRYISCIPSPQTGGTPINELYRLPRKPPRKLSPLRLPHAPMRTHQSTSVRLTARVMTDFLSPQRRSASMPPANPHLRARGGMLL